MKEVNERSNEVKPPRVALRLEGAVAKVVECLKHMQNKVLWHNQEERSLWHELVACILGSGVPFEHAKAAAAYLDKSGLIRTSAQCRYDIFEKHIATALGEPIFPPYTKDGRGRKYRFPRLRANHIRRTAECIYGRGDTIAQLLLGHRDQHSARVHLIERAVGIGPKQASLFLRNVGFSDELAILDVHVLRYMFLVGLLPVCFTTVQCLRRYEAIESRLHAYAHKLDVTVGSLDTAIWVAMRVYQRDFAQRPRPCPPVRSW